MALRLIAPVINVLIIRGNSAWGLSFWRNSTLPKGVSPKEVEKYIQNNDFIKDLQELQDQTQISRVNGPAERDLDILLSSLDPYWHPDVYRVVSHLLPLSFSLPDIKEAWILDSLKVDLRKL